MVLHRACAHGDHERQEDLKIEQELVKREEGRSVLVTRKIEKLNTTHQIPCQKTKNSQQISTSQQKVLRL